MRGAAVRARQLRVLDFLTRANFPATTSRTNRLRSPAGAAPARKSSGFETGAFSAIRRWRSPCTRRANLLQRSGGPCRRLLQPMAPTETPRGDPPPSWDAARRQAALVRALTYELERHAAVGAAEAI